uniref:PIN domain-containing protein n=1 Tax=Candidatus Kentrum sp. DK TaxID=2126562 RepID=A0A450S9C4_9GAMM|nr:MAG: PIN domain-containing protein [Candidatus Kentron sp. DK]
MTSELYAKLTLRSLTALKMASKCSFTLCKLRFLDHFCLVMKHNSSFAVASSELVIVEASAGDPEAAARRLDALQGIAELPIDEEIQKFADQLMSKGGIPAVAKADALHIAITAVHGIDYLLTWNLRHIDNPVKKPRIRSICADAGYSCPEICTPAELLQRTEF